MDNHILKSGKHEGKTFKQVLSEELSYCQWVLKTTDSQTFNTFRNYLRPLITVTTSSSLSSVIEGTIKHVLPLPDNYRVGTRLRIKAVICKANGDTVMIEGEVTTNVYPLDFVRGYFDYSKYDDHFKSSGIIEVLPPINASDRMAQCTALAREHKIYMTPKRKSLLATLYDNSEFWKVVLNSEYESTIGPLQPVIQTYCDRYKSNHISAIDIVEFFRGIGIKWTEKVIRKITRCERDFEQPNMPPILQSDIIDDPFVLLRTNISPNHFNEYLEALLRMGMITGVQVKFGNLMKNCLTPKKTAIHVFRQQMLTILCEMNRFTKNTWQNIMGLYIEKGRLMQSNL